MDRERLDAQLREALAEGLDLAGRLGFPAPRRRIVREDLDAGRAHLGRTIRGTQ
jgi:hypothetical protein